jgi:hypothetical protein
MGYFDNLDNGLLNKNKNQNQNRKKKYIDMFFYFRSIVF